MKRFIETFTVFLVVLLVTSTAFGKETTPSARNVAPGGEMPKVTTKGVKPAHPLPFQVTSVEFHEMSQNNLSFLAVGIYFNKDVDPASVQQNVNIRLLKKDENHFWRDASTQNNNVRVVQHVITWASGAPLENGYYVMHLRGTLKSKDGLFLDCNGDGQGEGGALPPYESAIYQVNIPEPGMLDPREIEGLRDQIGP